MCLENCFPARMHGQFAVDVLDMGLHGSDRYRKKFRDLAIAVALRNEIKNRRLTLGKAGRCRGF